MASILAVSQNVILVQMAQKTKVNKDRNQNLCRIHPGFHNTDVNSEKVYGYTGIKAHLLVFVVSDFWGGRVSGDLFTPLAWSLGFAAKAENTSSMLSFLIAVIQGR